MILASISSGTILIPGDFNDKAARESYWALNTLKCTSCAIYGCNISFYDFKAHICCKTDTSLVVMDETHVAPMTYMEKDSISQSGLFQMQFRFCLLFGTLATKHFLILHQVSSS